MIKETTVYLDNYIVHLPNFYRKEIFCDINFCVYFSLTEGDDITPSSVGVEEVQLISAEAYTLSGKELSQFGLEKAIKEEGILEDYVDDHMLDLVHKSVEV